MPKNSLDNQNTRYRLLVLSIVFLLGIVLVNRLGWGLLIGVSSVLLLFRPVFQRMFVFAPDFMHRMMSRLPASGSQPITQFIVSPTRKFGLAILALVLLLGGVRYRLAQPRIDTTHIAHYNDGEGSIALTGIISNPPDMREKYVQVEVQAESFYRFDDYQEIPAAGRVLVRLPLKGDWHYGDRVMVFGQLQTPPEGELFSYRDYLARNGILSYMPYTGAELIERNQGGRFLSLLFSFKEAALAKIYQLWPDPEASLLAGILLGVESGIPDDVEAAFINTSTSHIIAISGFNFTIITGLMISLFSKWLGKRRGALVAMVVIAIYTILVGANAAVVRAALMGGLGLIASQLGRRQDGLTSLSFVAMLMALWNPHVLWDVGFQLSFAATLGLIMFVTPLTDWFEGLLPESLERGTVRQLSNAAGEYFLFTIAAQIMILPILIYHFQRLSIISLPANVAILPAQPPVMIVGGLAVLLSFVFQPLGQLVAYLTWPFVAYTIRAVELFDRVPGGNLVVGEPALWQVALLYVLLFAAIWRWETIKEKMTSVWQPTLIFTSLFVVTALVWQAALHTPDGLLHVTLLQNEQGVPGSVLVQTPDGRILLINGGGSIRDLSDALGRRIPLGQRELDWLIISEPKDDWALSNIVPRFPPQTVLWAVDDGLDAMAGGLESFLIRDGIDVQIAQSGDELDLGQGISLEVIDLHKDGSVLALRWQGFTLHLPANAPALVEGFAFPLKEKQAWLELTTDGQEIWVQAGR